MFKFIIPGNPVAQKQTRISSRGGFPRFYDPSAKDKKYIQNQIMPFAPGTPLAQPVEMTLIFIMPIPKSTPKYLQTKMLLRTVLPDKKPDEDNLAYLVTNALKGIVYDDDRRICAKHVFKVYGAEPKTVIYIRPILEHPNLGYYDESCC